MERLASQNLKATMFDKIAGLSYHMFNQLLGTITDTLAGRKVMAALVMKRGDADDGIVISLGTGQ